MVTPGGVVVPSPVTASTGRADATKAKIEQVKQKAKVNAEKAKQKAKAEAGEMKAALQKTLDAMLKGVLPPADDEEELPR